MTSLLILSHMGFGKNEEHLYCADGNHWALIWGEGRIPGARSRWQINFVQFGLIFQGDHCGTCSFLFRFWCLEFWGSYWVFRKVVHPGFKASNN